jgi:predicted Zn-dependent peptidase
MNKQTAESQANEIGNAWFYTGDWREAFRTLEHEANVSPDEMNEAAFRYLDDFTFIIVGDPKAVDANEYVEAVAEPSGSEE